MRRALIPVLVFASCALTPPPTIAPAPPTGRVMIELGDVNHDVVSSVTEALDKFESDPKVTEVWLRINSHGGVVEEGISLIQRLETFRKPIICVVDTRALSMGMSVLEGCPHRLMTKRSSLMMHEVLVQSAGGTQTELADVNNEIRVLTEGLVQIAASRLNITSEQIRQNIKGRQWWLDWQEAVAVGAVDGIVEPKDLPDLTPLVPARVVTLRDLLGG